MINNEFWKDAAASWMWNAKPDFDVKVGSGGQISEELLKKPWESTDIDFAEIEDCEIDAEIYFDMEKYDTYFEMETITGFLNCFVLLRNCSLPVEMTDLYQEIIKRMKVLDEATDKYKKIYEADISMFIENYIPEALSLSVGYIECVNAKICEETLISTQNEVVEALDTLLIGINDKIEEIYKFASMELKATAKALNANMNMDGYVDPKFKIN